MNEFYIENDPYNWFDRLDKMEKDLKNIIENDESVLSSTKKYFADRKYDLVETYEKEPILRYAFYNEELGETIVFITEPDLMLTYISFSIHNGLVKDLENFQSKDNPNEFFSIFLD